MIVGAKELRVDLPLDVLDVYQRAVVGPTERMREAFEARRTRNATSLVANLWGSDQICTFQFATSYVELAFAICFLRDAMTSPRWWFRARTAVFGDFFLDVFVVTGAPRYEQLRGSNSL